MAKRDGKRVADVVNSALKLFIEKENDGLNNNYTKEENTDTFILRNDGEITISKSDIVGLEREVGSFSIENTGHLIFDKDIDKKVLKHIESIIIRDGTVEVPRNLYSHFLIRSEIHGKLWKY